MQDDMRRAACSLCSMRHGHRRFDEVQRCGAAWLDSEAFDVHKATEPTQTSDAALLSAHAACPYAATALAQSF